MFKVLRFLDDFIKSLDSMEDKMKEQKTSKLDKDKIEKVLKRIVEKMSKIVDAAKK